MIPLEVCQALALSGQSQAFYLHQDSPNRGSVPVLPLTRQPIMCHSHSMSLFLTCKVGTLNLPHLLIQQIYSCVCPGPWGPRNKDE